MPLIHTVAPENAEGQVKEIYNQIASALGSVPNALQIYSSSPDLLARQWQQIGYYMQHPALSFNLLAMMRMLISEATHCEYCVGFNKAMLIFVVRATAESLAVNQSDIAALKAHGWTDGDILDGLEHGAYMLAADVILNAMKIERDF